MPVPTRLAKAKLDAVYWDNYVKYLNTIDDRQSRIGQGKPIPPQIELYVKPFSLTLDTDQYIKANGTSSRWGTFQAHFTSYTKADIDEAGGEMALDLRFRAAKVVIKTGMSTNKTVRKALTTGKDYVTYGGESGSVPFGKNTTDLELDVFNTIRAAIKADATNFSATTMKVSRIKEKA